MKTIQKLGYSALAVALTGVHSTFAQINMGAEKVQQNVQGSKYSADVTIQNLVGNAMMFLSILAVLYGIYGGFLMLTAGGDEDKVSKGKTILIQVAIGLVVIFLANSIVQFIVGQILKSNL